MKVIALTGRAGSGKDTAAYLFQLFTTKTHLVPLGEDAFKEMMGKYANQPFSRLNVTERGNPVIGHFHIHKFAWPVYQVAGILLNRNPDGIISDPTFKNKVQKWGLTGRELLQKIGTECFRDVISTEIWIDVMRERLKEAAPGVIISDLRFVNEALFLREEYNATIFKVLGRSSGVPTTHPSESAIDGLDCHDVIYNDGSYTQLAKNVAEICRNLNILNCKNDWK